MQTLPLSEAPRSATASEFLRRVLRFQHMDFEYTVWQMLYLCVNPTRIYRTTTYHSRTKHQWARDDPAFVVLVLYLLLVALLSAVLILSRLQHEALKMLYPQVVKHMSVAPRARVRASSPFHARASLTGFWSPGIRSWTRNS